MANAAHDGKQWGIYRIATQVLLQNGNNLGDKFRLLGEYDNVLTINVDSCLDWQIAEVHRKAGQSWCQAARVDHVVTESGEWQTIIVYYDDEPCRRRSGGCCKSRDARKQSAK